MICWLPPRTAQHAPASAAALPLRRRPQQLPGPLLAPNSQAHQACQPASPPHLCEVVGSKGEELCMVGEVSSPQSATRHLNHCPNLVLHAGPCGRKHLGGRRAHHLDLRQ